MGNLVSASCFSSLISRKVAHDIALIELIFLKNSFNPPPSTLPSKKSQKSNDPSLSNIRLDCTSLWRAKYIIRNKLKQLTSTANSCQTLIAKVKRIKSSLSEVEFSLKKKNDKKTPCSVAVPLKAGQTGEDT